MRKIITVILIIYIFLPSSILAIGDQRCWKKNECAKQRAVILGISENSQEAKDGFMPAKSDESVSAACPNNIDATGEEIGFCLPAGKTVTTISFGGTTEFGNIGDFIKFAYRYAMWAATIIAVALIVISGIQWTASGGNTDMISSAKKRIAGAVSGLILLAFAYTILNTINPFLVNLRLPQAWLINEQGLVPPFCDQLKGGEDLAYFKQDEEKIKQGAEVDMYKQAQYSISSDLSKYNGRKNNDPKIVPACGYEYFVGRTGGQTCKGNLCEQNETCSGVVFESIKGGAKDKVSKQACLDGNIIIHFKVDSLMQEIGAKSGFLAELFIDILDSPEWIDDDSTAGGDTITYIVCEDDKIDDALSTKPDSNILHVDFIRPGIAPSIKKSNYGEYIYQLKLYEIKNIEKTCGGKIKGIIFKVDIDTTIGLSYNKIMDWNLYIGQKPNSSSAVLGTWDEVQKNLISFENAKNKGVYLEARMTDEVLNSLHNKRQSEPHSTDFTDLYNKINEINYGT